jgi:hypothetical protein
MSELFVPSAAQQGFTPGDIGAAMAARPDLKIGGEGGIEIPDVEMLKHNCRVSRRASTACTTIAWDTVQRCAVCFGEEDCPHAQRCRGIRNGEDVA